MSLGNRLYASILHLIICKRSNMLVNCWTYEDFKMQTLCLELNSKTSVTLSFGDEVGVEHSSYILWIYDSLNNQAYSLDICAFDVSAHGPEIPTVDFFIVLFDRRHVIVLSIGQYWQLLYSGIPQWLSASQTHLDLLAKEPCVSAMKALHCISEHILVHCLLSAKHAHRRNAFSVPLWLFIAQVFFLIWQHLTDIIQWYFESDNWSPMGFHFPDKREFTWWYEIYFILQKMVVSLL